MDAFKTGFLRSIVIAALSALAFATGQRAEASTLEFTLSGDYNYHWTIDTTAAPTGSGVDGDTGYSYVYFSNVPGLPRSNLIFYQSSVPGFDDGGIKLSDNLSALDESVATFDLQGPQLYDVAGGFHFILSTFAMNNDFFTNAAPLTLTTLTIAATPIPAALPLFVSALAGLGFVGWRRRTATLAR